MHDAVDTTMKALLFIFAVATLITMIFAMVAGVMYFVEQIRFATDGKPNDCVEWWD